jgi:hypothetical protein
MKSLPRREEDGVPTADQRITTRVGSELQLADTFALSKATGRFEVRSELDRLLRRTEQSVGEMSDHISQLYFSHSAAKRISGNERSGGR